jgi:3-hydroxyisobutyrate dehydrogenase-like beta-hydroxyacid dehydrogenase
VHPSGSGAWLKLINNAASIATLVALGELLALTDRASLQIDVVLDSLKLGPLASLIDRWR